VVQQYKATVQATVQATVPATVQSNSTEPQADDPQTEPIFFPFCILLL
jgi:hypothetical protein